MIHNGVLPSAKKPVWATPSPCLANASHLQSRQPGPKQSPLLGSDWPTQLWPCTGGPCEPVLASHVPDGRWTLPSSTARNLAARSALLAELLDASKSPQDRHKMAQKQGIPAGGSLSPPCSCAKSGTSEAKFNLPCVGRNPDISLAKFCWPISCHFSFKIHLNQNIFI